MEKRGSLTLRERRSLTLQEHWRDAPALESPLQEEAPQLHKLLNLCGGGTSPKRKGHKKTEETEEERGALERALSKANDRVMTPLSPKRAFTTNSVELNSLGSPYSPDSPRSPSKRSQGTRSIGGLSPLKRTGTTMTTFSSGPEMLRAGTRTFGEDAEEREGLTQYTNPESIFEALEHRIDGVPAVRLLRMTWLLEHRPRVLQKRQELPEDAFLPLDELRDIWEESRYGGPDRVVPVIVVSACWDTRDHPDPKGMQLKLVIDTLERESKKYAKESHYFRGFREMGIFWDWTSLFQIEDLDSVAEQPGDEDDGPKDGREEDPGDDAHRSAQGANMLPISRRRLTPPPPRRVSAEVSEVSETRVDSRRESEEATKQPFPEGRFTPPAGQRLGDMSDVEVDPCRQSEESTESFKPSPDCPELFEPAKSGGERSRTESGSGFDSMIDWDSGADVGPGKVRLRKRPASIIVIDRKSCWSSVKPWSTVERRAFDYAVSETMELWYAHRGTSLLAVTQHPRKRGSSRPSGYEESGWVTFERMAAEQMQKPKRCHARWDPILELRGDDKAKAPKKRWPVGLQDFEEVTDKRAFAQESDRDTVKALYRRLSNTQFGSVKELSFKDMPDMKPEDARRLGGCLNMCDSLEELRLNKCGIDGANILEAIFGRLEEDSLPKLRFLGLCQNHIADGGLKAIASAAALGAMPMIRELWLSSNKIGCGGIEALADAGAKGAFDKVTELSLEMNCIGDSGMKAFCRAAANGAFSSLTDVLWLNNNQVGDVGAQAIADAATKGAFSHLLKIALYNNDIGDLGAQALARAAIRGGFPDLGEMDLSKNNIGDAGALAIARAISAGRLAGDYRRLYVTGNSMSPKGEQALEKARSKEGVSGGCCTVS